ncbi:MAG TPA: tRNA (guanosine(46)-N7)-methyltransferase TrmB [Gammaproteobacteria bacterium]|jgi:tRNA (guanine-N7-)-methyltransferase|nr:tRNA (guanosine(46)-N7)-methyltransferase TrmB [Gammaproteobacteria bacterium]
MTSSTQQNFRIRSFVIRGGRGTPAQVRAMRDVWPAAGLELGGGMLDMPAVFGREAPVFLEIGFGTGQSLLAAAAQNPDKNFIGVETHRPGVGALLMGIEQLGLTNLRVFRVDVIDVLDKCIPDNSLAGVQIFFPDPWQKRRHFPRRLVQPEFLHKLAVKLQQRGSIHLATDWEDYAVHMMQVVSASTEFKNTAGENQFGSRSPYRPVISKFEQRAIREGRSVRELQLVKK